MGYDVSLVRFEQHEKMEVDEQVDGKMMLAQRKKELQKQLRRIGEFTDVPQDMLDMLKEKRQQRC